MIRWHVRPADRYHPAVPASDPTIPEIPAMPRVRRPAILSVLFALLAPLVAAVADDAAAPDGTIEFRTVQTELGPLVDDPENEKCYEYVVITTTSGEFILELHRCAAPKTVENFLKYIDAGWYDDTLIHRVMNRFVIQGGGYDLDENEKPNDGPIPSEWPNGLQNDRGAIAMARADDPGSATTQFFINVKDNPNLDRPSRGNAGYCVFGRVVRGMEVVDAISIVDTIRKPNMGDAMGPIKPIQVIQAARVPADEAAALLAEHEQDRLKVAVPAVTERLEVHWKEVSRERNKNATEDQRIQQAIDYIAKQGWDITKGVRLPSGVWYIDDVVGVGDPPGLFDEVAMTWEGWLAWGEKFGSWDQFNKGEVLRGRVDGFVPGYQEALLSMRPGGHRVVVIPSNLAYGSIGREPLIPADAALIYKIRLLGVVPAGEAPLQRQPEAPQKPAQPQQPNPN